VLDSNEALNENRRRPPCARLTETLKAQQAQLEALQEELQALKDELATRQGQ